MAGVEDGSCPTILPQPSGNLNTTKTHSSVTEISVTCYNAITKLPLMDEICNSLLEPETGIMAKQLGGVM